RAYERHRGEHHEHSDQPYRQVDVKDPSPAPGVGDVTARGRADDRRQAEHGAEQTGKPGPLRRGKEVADYGEDGGEEHAAEDALDGAEGDQLQHAVRLAAQGGGDDEPDHAGEQEWLAAEQVAQLAGDW